MVLEQEEAADADETADPILRSEFDRDSRDLSRNKAPGIDDIPSELPTAIREASIARLFHLECKMHGIGGVPSDFRQNVVIPIPKKTCVDKTVTTMKALVYGLVFSVLVGVQAKNSTSDITPNITVTEEQLERQRATPCACAEGQCGCCTGMLLQQFNINLRQKGCVNITYDPDEFAFKMDLSINNRVLYTNTYSGKNPRPVCVPLPRVPSVRFCVQLYNVYFIGRNAHACVGTRVRWNDYSLYEATLNCIRIGADGVAIVTPEDGGGLPQIGSETSEEGNDEDYDDDDEDEDYKR
ncbi:uncharacterized protein [Anabrus simplex]|uniref:uncharacterized protein n=1 Tax=Anabrus simplex TaxID=316456 RepID=UPI0035A38406